MGRTRVSDRRILSVETFSWVSGGRICSPGDIEVELRFDNLKRLISEIRGIGELISRITRGEIIEEALQEVWVVAQEVKGGEMSKFQVMQGGLLLCLSHLIFPINCALNKCI